MPEPRTLSVSEAAALVRPVDVLALPLGPGQPAGLLNALGDRDDYQDLKVSTALLTGFYGLFTRPGVELRSGFFGPVERALHDAGHRVHFVPADFRRFGRIAEATRPRVMATGVAPPDADGNLSLSLHAGATVDELRRCGRDPERLLIAEVNRKLPYTLGLPPEHLHAIPLAEVDVLVEHDHDPIALPDPEPTDVDRAIAEHARAFIHDGCTLQTGIGAVPSLMAQLLADGPGGDYGVHSEMFTTGLMHLHKADKITNRKGLFDGVSICTFAMGTKELYEWLDGQELVRFLPVDVVNSPALIAQNRALVSLNGALTVDLTGQVAADTVGGSQYSGIGGHEDFVAGAGERLEDRSLVCLPSTASAGGKRISRIAANFEPGTTVTTPRHQVDVVITEYGSAELLGLTVEERCAALTAIAHPDFRSELAAAVR